MTHKIGNPRHVAICECVEFVVLDGEFQARELRGIGAAAVALTLMVKQIMPYINIDHHIILYIVA